MMSLVLVLLLGSVMCRDNVTTVLPNAIAFDSVGMSLAYITPQDGEDYRIEVTNFMKGKLFS